MPQTHPELRTIVALIIRPDDLEEIEAYLTQRYPNWCHLMRPDKWGIRANIPLEVALDPPNDEWTKEDEEYFERHMLILSWQKLDSEAWYNAIQ